MIIFINCRFLTQNITGVQRFSIEISKRLKKLLGDNVKFISPKNIIHTDLAKELDAKIIGNRTGHLWEQIDLPLYLSQNNKPLLLNLANTAPIFYKNKLTVIHSLAFTKRELNSFLFYYAYKITIPIIIWSSKHIFTVSTYTLNEIVNYYNYIGNLKEKISVVYNGYIQDLTIEKEINNSNYILYVGSLSKGKNISVLINALKIINKDHGIINLKIVGSVNKTIFAEENLDNYGWIEYTGHINDRSQLLRLYQNAKIFVFPSLYESFGIPPVEAQAAGCPVICSNSTSLPEVCGEGAIYFNPNDVDDLTNKIRLLLSNEDLQGELRIKGFENIKRFSWEESSKKIIEIIRRLK